MSREIRLLYFNGCPNVDAARANLRAALAQAGLPVRWVETDLESRDCPQQWRGFPSPTVLVGGADVATGAQTQSGTSACRFGGPPSSVQIVAVLRSRSWLAPLAAILAAAAGLVPASFCPACIPALAGLLGALGLGGAAERIMQPLTLVLLLVALAGLVYQARRNGERRPLIAGAAGVVAMYTGQFVLESAVVKWLGIALLVGASFWNVLPRNKKTEAKDCPACK